MSVLHTSAHWTASRPGSISVFCCAENRRTVIDAQEDACRSVPHIERGAACAVAEQMRVEGRLRAVRRQNISDIRFGKLREYLAHLV